MRPVTRLREDRSQAKTAARRHGEDYLRAMTACLSQISTDEIERLAEEILLAYERDAQLFLAGNGGSASLCSHLACDLGKTLLGKNPTTAKKRFRVISMCDNLSLLTAWANDVSFDTVFAEQLKGLARPGDVLLVITGSGNSPNILRALETAQEVGMKTLGWLGFDGGKALSLCDRSILVRTHDYGLVESAHAVLTHLITSWLMGCRGGEP